MASAFHYTLFYYPSFYYYNPSFYNYLTYRDAIATRTISGVNFRTYLPLSKYYRTQAALSFTRYEEEFLYPYFREQISVSGSRYDRFLSGNWLAATFSLVGETTRFNFFGPSSGNTFMISISQSLPISDNFLQNTNFQADLRQYLNIGADMLFAFRFEAFASRGKDPFIYYFGGNNQVRAVNYASIIANEAWYGNAEFRFPIINAASSIIGQLGPVRGVFFFDITRSKIKGLEAKFYTFDGFEQVDNSLVPKFREADAIGSFGYGFEFFLLGIPIHLEFVKRIEFQDISRPFQYKTYGDFKTEFWIGFDF